MANEHTLTDIKIMFDFLKHDDGSCDTAQNHQAQLTSLQTLSSMCNKEVADIMNDSGGLNLIWRLCGSTTNPEVCQSCLYTLACATENSEKVKLTLCSNRTFASIGKILETQNISYKTHLFAIYFLIALISENETGQECARNSGCLPTLLNIFKSGVELTTSENTKKYKCKRDLWSLATKALRYSVHLPRNEINQTQCSRFFPHMVTIMHESKGEIQIVMQTCKLFSAVVENNSRCQNEAIHCRALEVLILLLQSSFLNSEKRELVGDIITAMCNLLPEHEESCDRFVKLGGVTILLQVLKNTEGETTGPITVPEANHILTVFSRCSTHSERSRQQLRDYNAASTIVSLMNTVKGDEYFNKIAVSVLNYCMQESPEDPDDQKSEESESGEDKMSESEKSSSELSATHKQNTEKEASLKEFQHHVDEVFSIGGRSMMDILDRQQTQIELLQKLLLEERERRKENETTLQRLSAEKAETIDKDNCKNPDVDEFERCPRSVASSSATPARKSRKCSWNSENPDSYRNESTKLAQNYMKNKGQNHIPNILTSTIISPIRPNTLSPVLPLNGPCNLRQNNPNAFQVVIHDQATDETTCKAVISTQDSSCQTDEVQECSRSCDQSKGREEEIIDVESYTPRRNMQGLEDLVKIDDDVISNASSEKNEEECSEVRKVVKVNYYTKRRGKVSQHTRELRWREQKNPVRSDSLTHDHATANRKEIAHQEEDDVLSFCGDIIEDEIRKIRNKDRNGRKQRHRWTQPVDSSEQSKYHLPDAYEYGDPSPRTDRFKKPMTLPPRYKCASRSRIKFDSAEEHNLREGVKRLGRNFKDILYAYEFHSSRTAMDLRDKYRNMCKVYL